MYYIKNVRTLQDKVLEKGPQVKQKAKKAVQNLLDSSCIRQQQYQ